jgi:hypothetical protein
MRDNLHSNWSLATLLAALPEFRRTDDGIDLLAFRLAGAIPQHSVYVYLYGGDPDLIHFDLEDESANTDEWDHAVRRGSARSIAELRAVVLAWLQEGSAER